jgi:predicted flap endonuclease-1-like 5' DNA nuclease
LKEEHTVGYKLSDLKNVSGGLVKSLQALGIGDTDELLLAAANSDELKAMAGKLGVSEQMLAELANRADLLRVPGVGPAYAELLMGAGITSVAGLRAAGPDLFDHLGKAAQTLGIKGLPKSAEVSSWVNSAHSMADAGDWAIATKSDAMRAGFAADDWMKIRLAPAAAAALVVGASPSDKKDTALEMDTAVAALNAARAGARPESLINVAFGQDVTVDQLAKFMDETPPAAMLSTVKAAAEVVSRTVSADQFAAFQTMILDVAQKAAEAAKEGGFLGMGKKLVSDEEQAVLDQIRAAVGR